MNVPSGLRASRAWPVALTAAALLAVSVPLAGPASAQKTRADRCSEALQKNYGVAAPSGVGQHNSSNRRSVYADGTLENGDTVRFRCLFGDRGTPEVQVFAPAPPGSAKSWATWGPADAYQVPPKPDTPPVISAALPFISIAHLQLRQPAPKPAHPVRIVPRPAGIVKVLQGNYK